MQKLTDLAYVIAATCWMFILPAPAAQAASTTLVADELPAAALAALPDGGKLTGDGRACSLLAKKVSLAGGAKPEDLFVTTSGCFNRRIDQEVFLLQRVGLRYRLVMYEIGHAVELNGRKTEGLRDVVLYSDSADYAPRSVWVFNGTSYSARP